MIKDLLPIGSIVLLKDTPKKIMVNGVKQRAAEGEDEQVYDYCGVPYPEGNIGAEYTIMFNQDDIEDVIFRGFENIERDYFLNELMKFYEPENAVDIPAEPLQEELDAEKLGPGNLDF